MPYSDRTRAVYINYNVCTINQYNGIYERGRETPNHIAYLTHMSALRSWFIAVQFVRCYISITSAVVNVRIQLDHPLFRQIYWLYFGWNDLSNYIVSIFTFVSFIYLFDTVFYLLSYFVFTSLFYIIYIAFFQTKDISDIRRRRMFNYSEHFNS